MITYHIPVLPKETINLLQIKKDCWYIDGTLGGGGHTSKILDSGGKVLGLDLDPEAITEVAHKYNLTLKKDGDFLQALSNNLILYQTNFANLTEATKKFSLQPICGILLDLGVSTHQLETPHRGFCFNANAPLDMRMSPFLAVTAADLINALHEGELTELFVKLGEEKFAKPIARKIIEVRAKKRISTTDELAQIILSVRHRTKADRTHPATRVFQALRIAVNDELNSLKTTLPKAAELLSPGGRLAIISFHSLEDRIVKNFFKAEEEKGSFRIITTKPITPTEEEVETNPRSRSGKLRVAEKI